MIVEMKSMKKFVAIVNAALLVCISIGLLSFKRYGVTYMVYHCIPTIAVLAALFYLIYKEKLALYVTFVYLTLTVYMVAATICLGFNSGFHLYCMSLIPLSFYMRYMAHRLRIRGMSALVPSLILVVTYFVISGYVIINGPLYEVDPVVECNFLYANVGIVFFAVIGYANLMLKLVMDSEKKLTDMANTDQLTGLFNRHYMISHLDALYQGILPEQWIAMADIDDFKKINDTYGHDCGDYVLVKLAEIMRDTCGGCTISRWGGEEFLIISNTGDADPEILETLRKRVEETAFSYGGETIPVTITVGAARYQQDRALNGWIQSADSKLYDGKNSGKNRVVY